LPVAVHAVQRVVHEPVFLPRELWIPQPADWARNAVQGVTYDLTVGEGARVWSDCRPMASLAGSP